MCRNYFSVTEYHTTSPRSSNFNVCQLIKPNTPVFTQLFTSKEPSLQHPDVKLNYNTQNILKQPYETMDTKTTPYKHTNTHWTNRSISYLQSRATKHASFSVLTGEPFSSGGHGGLYGEDVQVIRRMGKTRRGFVVVWFSERTASSWDASTRCNAVESIFCDLYRRLACPLRQPLGGTKWRRQRKGGEWARATIRVLDLSVNPFSFVSRRTP